MTNATGTGEEIRISADSHVTEPFDLWETRLPRQHRDKAMVFREFKNGLGKYGAGNYIRSGGYVPSVALQDMAADGISAAVLFPSLGSKIFRQFAHDLELCKAHERVYNDWMLEYCSEDPSRLWGQALLSLWDIDYAVNEMERLKKAGLKGVCVWTAPPDDLPFTSPHYEPFWSAAEALELPVAMHINIGFGLYSQRSLDDRYEFFELRTYGHKVVALKAITDLVVSGVFERHPTLKILFAEFECGWIPFFLEDLDVKIGSVLDKDFHRDLGLTLLPSEYFSRSVCAGFMQDGVTGYLLERWGADNFCFSNDYPHLGGIWPFSDDVVGIVLGNLPETTRRKVLGENIARHYGQPMPVPIVRKPLMADVNPSDFEKPWLKKAGEFTFEKSKMGLAV